MRAIPLSSFLVLALISPHANAMSPSEYQESLRLADLHVRRMQAIAGRPGTLQSALASRIGGSQLRTGSSWLVAAYHEPGVELHPEHGAAPRVAVFRYRVKSIDEAPGGRKIHVEVTEETQKGGMPLDPRVEALEMVFGPEWELLSKEYRFRGLGRTVAVSPDGLRARSTPWEIFPLDAPGLHGAQASGETSAREPQLPARLKQLLEERGETFEPAGAQALEQDDFFGRPVRMLWKSGDPWPLLLRTSLGQTVLIRKEAP